jgi:MFS transporter, FHS family, L-fucose permease
LQLSFLLTVICELYILFYAVWGSKVPAMESARH